MENSSPRTVLITGCDVPGSYGYELSLLLDKQKYNVFAGCTVCNSIGARSLASRGSENLAILQIDVKSEEDINDAVEMITDAVGDEGIWAVINCSETYVIAEVDWCSNDDFKNVFEVNLMGTIRVTKALLPLVQKARGRIINLSSSSGCMSRAGLSAYCASKFAVEAFSDSLRQEMHKWGVFVSIVEPVFSPDPKEALTSDATAEVLARVPEDLRQKYGGDYFGSYIQAALKDVGTETASIPLPQKLEPTADKGYHTWKKDAVDPAQLRRRARTLPPNAGGLSSMSNGGLSSQKRGGGGDSVSSTLTKAGGSKLSSTNRVLHALMDAVTSSTPKIRYFVGSFSDRMLVRCGAFLPVAFTDTYMTYGAISAIVPQRIKEKLD